MSLRYTFYAGLAALCWTVPAVAPAQAQISQAPTDQVGMAHAAAANQLGVLEYCQSKGSVGTDAVQAERSSIARLPASSVNTDAEESIGKSGTISANGNSMTLASIASGRNTTVAAICKQMGDAAIQTAAAFSNNAGGANMPAGMPMGMPSMPNMPAMPSGIGGMPNMPAMPNMPGFPAAPGAPAVR